MSIKPIHYIHAAKILLFFDNTTNLSFSFLAVHHPYQGEELITADNGKEFAKHQEIAEKLEISFYFCKPIHSWERGANENMNGLIRQYAPKGTDFSGITDENVTKKHLYYETHYSFKRLFIICNLQHYCCK